MWVGPKPTQVEYVKVPHSEGRLMDPFTQHLIFSVTYEWALKGRVLVPGKPFTPCLMVVSKEKAYPSTALG